MNSITQRDASRNQSTADIQHSQIFIFNNTYQSAEFSNATAGEVELNPGSLVLRDTGNGAQVVPAIAGATLSDVIGIVALDETITVAANGTRTINFATGGDVDETLLVLPGGVTLDTVPATKSKTVRDYLNALGFHLRATSNNTKFDN